MDNPLNWSPWWKYGIIALVSFIELLTLLCIYQAEIDLSILLGISVMLYALE
jgi:hypothetical protein